MQITQIVFLSSVFCLLLFGSAYAGLAVSVTGGNWAIGDIGMGITSATTANKWTITGSANTMESVYIKADGTNWHPGSAAGNKVFVLKYKTLASWSAAITNSNDGIRLTSLNSGGTAGFDLQFTAPTASTSVTGEQSLTVTLTAKAFTAPASGVWEAIDTDLVIVGTATGYLMWPRSGTGVGACSGGNLYYKDENTAGQPCWDDTAKTYNYASCSSWGPAGACTSHCAKANYPAFSWAEDLVYKNYTDWRLPTYAELLQLYNSGTTYITSAPYGYCSATEYDAAKAYFVGFSGGVGGFNKVTEFYVRAVRSGQ